MGNIDLSGLTIPTPEPYSRQSTTAQQENLAYVLLQVFLLAKIEGFVITSGDVAVNVNLDAVVESIEDLKFNSITFDLGAFRAVLDGRTLEVIDPEN